MKHLPVQQDDNCRIFNADWPRRGLGISVNFVAGHVAKLKNYRRLYISVADRDLHPGANDL